MCHDFVYIIIIIIVWLVESEDSIECNKPYLLVLFVQWNDVLMHFKFGTTATHFTYDTSDVAKLLCDSKKNTVDLVSSLFNVKWCFSGRVRHTSAPQGLWNK